MRTTMYLCAALLGGILSAPAQSTIAYFNGPAFPIPGYFGTASLDLDQDGTNDFNFSAGPFVGVGDGSGTSEYVITPAGTNEVQVLNYQAALLPAGASISSVTFSNAVWTNTDGATMFSLFIGGIGTGFWGGPIIFPINGWPIIPTEQINASGWSGPFTVPGGGYMGVRFYAADGLHYGWIHALLSVPDGDTNPLDGSPLITDWAFETRPNTAIIAGAKPVPASLAAPQFVRPGTLRLTWQSQINQAYQIEFKDQLDAPLWTNFSPVITATATNSTAEVSITGPSRFFRVVQAN